MQNLASYTGKPGHVRIGGNTQDYFIYDDSLDTFEIRQNPNSLGQGAVPSDNFLIGARFFEAIDRSLPAGTPVTFGLNLAYYEADYLEKITAMAQAAVRVLKKVNLVSFEIGNEPDLYLENSFRNGKNPPVVAPLVQSDSQKNKLCGSVLTFIRYVGWGYLHKPVDEPRTGCIQRSITARGVAREFL